MAAGGSLGGRTDVGGAMDAPWNMNTSTMSFASVNGPAAGEAVSTMASKGMGLGNVGKFGLGLELPTLIALGVLCWWVVNNLDD